jgi:hypothetical protein
MDRRRRRQPRAQVKRAHNRVRADLREQARRNAGHSAEDEPAGYGVKRAIRCDTGFFGAAAVWQTLGGRPAYADKGGVTLIDRAQARRVAAAYPGPMSELGARLEAACAQLPTRRVGRIEAVEILSGVPERDHVALIPDEDLQQTLRDETRFLHIQIGHSALSNAARYVPHATLYVTSSRAEAINVLGQLQALTATEAQEFVLGAPFVKPIWV